MRLAVLAMAFAAALPTGCASDPTRGYALGGAHDSGVRSVAVPMFENRTFVTGIEVELTDAVVKKIQSSTPWVVTSPESADTTLSGTITHADLARLSVTPGTGLVQEQAVSIAASFEWTDNRTGKPLERRTGLRAVSTFTPSRGADGQPGERLEIGQRDAIDELAREIVDQLRSAW